MTKSHSCENWSDSLSNTVRQCVKQLKEDAPAAGRFYAGFAREALMEPSRECTFFCLFLVGMTYFCYQNLPYWPVWLCGGAILTHKGIDYLLTIMADG